MALIKKYKCMNIGNCKDANKTIIEIPVGEKLECPTCHKDILVEVKNGVNLKMIAGIAAAVVVLGGAGAYFAGAFGGGEKSDADSLKNDSVIVMDSVENEPATPETEKKDTVMIKTGELDQTPETNRKDIGEKTQGDSTFSTLNLGWASYEGSVSGGKPHGAGGILTIKSNHSIDLKNGSTLDVNPGDKIVNTKFTNGVLRQGELQRKNGERKYFNIG